MSNLINILTYMINEKYIHPEHEMEYILSPKIYDIDYIEKKLKNYNINYNKTIDDKNNITFQLEKKDSRLLWNIIFLDNKSIHNKVYHPINNK